MICDALEELQRAALDSPRPQVVVKVDRSGLNEHHPVVQRLHAAIERVLRPIVAAEERRAGAHLVRARRAIAGARRGRPARAQRRAARARSTRPAAPASSAAERRRHAAARRRVPSGEPSAPSAPARRRHATRRSTGALRFKQSPVRLHPGRAARRVAARSTRRASRPARRSTVAADAGLRLKLLGEPVVPEPNRRGWSRMTGTLRARVSVEPGLAADRARRGRAATAPSSRC